MTPEALKALSHGELVALVVALRVRLDALEADNGRLRAENEALKAEAGKNSGNSSKPPSRDPAVERERQAEERRAKRQRAAGGKRRRPGKQPGTPGTTLEMSDSPDEVVIHAPEVCGGCGHDLGDAPVTAEQRRQVVDLPEVIPEVTEHRAQTRLCGCGTETTAGFPESVRGPISYGPRVRAIVAYLLARQHIPVERCSEAMRDLFGVKVSTGTIDAIYAEAARRLAGFIAALVAVLRSLPVLHADETTDRIGTKNCWMHVVSTSTYTLIHASVTRGFDAVRAAGVLIGYTGVVIHDRLALYWKLKAAKHGICGAHLLRDLASVATVAPQAAWATGLASLLVEISAACDAARSAGRKKLAPGLQRGFSARYDALVAQGSAANPEPPAGAERTRLERKSANLAIAFATHKQAILAYMRDLDVAFTNNQGERDLRPVKLHRKISSCFKSQAGAERFAAVRSYLSTTRKHDIPAIDALTSLFNGDPWMPGQQ
ncbi:MAG: IS66 family transposase [Acidimicrobiales bacterium]